MNIQGYSSASAPGAITVSTTNKQSLSNTDDKAGDLQQPGSDSTVNISAAALALARASEKVDNLLAEEGRSVYQTAIKSLKVYPENLATKLSDGSLPGSSQERSEIANKLTAIEHDAYAKYAKEIPPNYEMYFKKYVEYFDSLSPEDQQSQRYGGTRADAVSAYQRHAGENGSEVEDLSFVQDPILSLFDALQERDFSVNDPVSFRQAYEDQIAPLFLRQESGLDFKIDAERVLERFDAVQTVIGSAREGNHSAFEHLQLLAGDPAYLDEFLAYSNELTQPEIA